MTKQTQQKAVGRRAFLRAAGAGAAAAAAATAVVAPAKVEAAENAETRKKARYRETEHVKKFYDICRM